MGTMSQRAGEEQGCCELTASLPHLPGQHPHQQLMSTPGRRSQTEGGGGGIQRRLGKALDREPGPEQFQDLLINGCKNQTVLAAPLISQLLPGKSPRSVSTPPYRALSETTLPYRGSAHPLWLQTPPPSWEASSQFGVPLPSPNPWREHLLSLLSSSLHLSQAHSTNSVGFAETHWRPQCRQNLRQGAGWVDH